MRTAQKNKGKENALFLLVAYTAPLIILTTVVFVKNTFRRNRSEAALMDGYEAHGKPRKAEKSYADAAQGSEGTDKTQ